MDGSPPRGDVSRSDRKAAAPAPPFPTSPAGSAARPSGVLSAAAAIDASATPGAADALSRLLGALALAFESYPPDLEVSAVDTWATWLTRALTAVTAAPSSSWLGGKVAKLLAPATLVDGLGLRVRRRLGIVGARSGRARGRQVEVE